MEIKVKRTRPDLTRNTGLGAPQLGQPEGYAINTRGFQKKCAFGSGVSPVSFYSNHIGETFSPWETKIF